MNGVQTEPSIGARSINIRRRRTVQRNLWCWLFMLPTVTLYVLFQGYPIVSSVFYSMLDWSGMSANATWVGLKNFDNLLNDPLFGNAILNSIKYMALCVPIQLVVSLLLAYILNSVIKRGMAAYRTMYFLPVVTTASIVGIIMVFIFGGTGPVNQVLIALGMDKAVNWLGNAATALPTVVLIGVWKDVGTYMIYWLAALQSVPQDVYEAATIDGAGRVKTFTHVVLPLILPIGGMISILCIVSSLKVFDIIQTMTEGGPFFATDVVATFVYRTAYSSTMGMPRLGYASAAAMLFGLMIVAVGLLLNMAKSALKNRRSV